MKAYNNLSLAICLLLSVDSSKAIRQHLRSHDEADVELLQNAKDAIAYNNIMLTGKKIVKELPDQAPSQDSELELDPESPLFFAQSHDEQVRATQIREEQSHAVVRKDKDQIDTDYTEKPDGIEMSDQLRSVVSFVQLENDVQIKQENKQSETQNQKQKIEVKTDTKNEVKTQNKNDVKQKTKQNVNDKLMTMLGGEDAVVPQDQVDEPKTEEKSEDKKEEGEAKPQPDQKETTEAPAEDKKASTEEAPVEGKKTAATQNEKTATEAQSDETKTEDIKDQKLAYQKKDNVDTKGSSQENKTDLSETKTDASPLEKASEEATQTEEPKTETAKEVKKADVSAKDDKKSASDKSSKKEEIDASAFDFTVNNDGPKDSKTEDTQKSDASAETETKVQAPKAETQQSLTEVEAAPAPALAVVAPVKSKTSDLIKKLKANAAAKLAKQKALSKKIVKKTPPPVQEFVKNVQEQAESIPQEQIAAPVQAAVSSKAPKSNFVPFAVPKNLFKEMSPQEKAAKDKLENPTVDEDGNHIQTVAEAKLEAAAMQNMLDEGVADVDKKIEQRNIQMAQEDALHKDEPVKQEEDDGHIETVEEVKAKMKILSENMNNNLAAVDTRAQASQEEQAAMPDMSALTTFTSTIHSMSGSQAKRQATLLAARLGVPLGEGEENLQVSQLTSVLVERAQQAGKSAQEIQEAISE